MKNDKKDSLFEILEEKTFEQNANQNEENTEKLRKNVTQNEVSSVKLNSKKTMI